MKRRVMCADALSVFTRLFTWFRRKITSVSAYAEQFRRSLDDPEGFWGEAAKAVEWTKSTQRGLTGDQLILQLKGGPRETVRDQPARAAGLPGELLWRVGLLGD